MAIGNRSLLGMFWAPCLAVALIVGLLQAPLAQGPAENPEAAWARLAEIAETTLETEAPSRASLLALRDQLVKSRAEALAISERGSVRVRSLQAQLRALGPAPQEGAMEAESITQRRLELTEALAVANEPVLDARQAFERADLLVREIDAILRQRSAARLLEAGPSPLSPESWVAAASEVSAFAVTVWEGLVESFQAQRSRVFRSSALIGVLVLIGTGALFWGHRLALPRLDALARSGSTAARRGLLAAAASAARLVVPLVGLSLVAAGFSLMGLDSPGFRSLQARLPEIVLMLAVPYWLGHLVFAPGIPEQRFVGADDQLARRGARTSVWLGVLLLAAAVLESAESDFPFTQPARAVLGTLVVGAAAAAIWRLASALLAASQPSEFATSSVADSDPIQTGLVNFVARALQLASVVAVAAAMVGYVPLALEAVVPTILSLGLIGIAIAAFRLVTLLPTAIFGLDAERERTPLALLPVVAGIVVALATIPGFALIWGARTTDIAELWLRANQGLDVGGIRLSLAAVLAMIIVFAAGLLVTRWVQFALRSSVLPRTRLDVGAQTATVTGVGYTGIFISAVIAVTAAGLDLTSLAFVAGALSVGIGFGLQAVVSNFVSGVILLVERPIKEGDWIEVAGHTGFVRKIAVRATRIETFDRHSVLVPNADLITGTVKNMTLGSQVGRVIVPVGVAYGSDLEKTRSIMIGAAQAQENVLAEPEPMVLFMGLGESSLDFELRCFIEDVNATLSTRSNLLFAIYTELDRAGISIPFPQRDVHIVPADHRGSGSVEKDSPNTVPHGG